MPPADPKSEVFCPAPWIGWFNTPSGHLSPCCAWSGQPAGRLGEKPLQELRQTPVLRQVRENILAGRPSAECTVCYARDRAGAYSLRQWLSRRYPLEALAALAPGQDLRRALPNTRHLHVSFSNVCNFSCRICSPTASTGWYRDAGLGRLDIGFLRGPLRPRDLLGQLEAMLPDVDTIHFNGGEPLLAMEHYILLERLLSLGLTGIRLVYNTNLSVLGLGRWDVLKLWHHFEDVHVTASLDAAGRRGEYLRKGQSWAKAVDNAEQLRRECPRVSFSIVPTVGILNALHVPDLHRECVELGVIDVGAIVLSPLAFPPYYSAQALPSRFKDKVAEAYERHIGGYLGRFGPEAEPARSTFRAMATYVAAEDLSRELPRFWKATRLLDMLRGERCSEVFPELDGLMPPAH